LAYNKHRSLFSHYGGRAYNKYSRWLTGTRGNRCGVLYCNINKEIPLCKQYNTTLLYTYQLYHKVRSFQGCYWKTNGRLLIFYVLIEWSNRRTEYETCIDFIWCLLFSFLRKHIYFYSGTSDVTCICFDWMIGYDINNTLLKYIFTETLLYECTHLPIMLNADIQPVYEAQPAPVTTTTCLMLTVIECTTCLMSD